MAFQKNRVPISRMLHENATGSANADDEPVQQTREDWRKAKDLEEARKAGTAPAAVDEDGRDINPHIPQYISEAPWYFGTTGPTLRHQRQPDDAPPTTTPLDTWYKRGADTSRAVHTKYRKGACENCGASTHKRVDCLERPRKVGAKYSGALVAYDDQEQLRIDADFDAKRDRWSGYDPSAHTDIINEYQKVEEAKQKIKADKLKQNPDAELESDGSADSNEDRYVDEADMPGTKVDSKQRITVRNLRIREDTAKYLRNLDPNSAYYDPKTRSMRDNPNPSKNPEESEFAGENFVRFSGDTTKHSQAQMFAWDAYGKGVDVHLLAEPTKLELLQHEYEKKKDQFKAQTKNTIVDAYGGEEHLQAPPRSLLLAQSEEYVEYSRGGKVIRGQEKVPNRSRYEEDVRINNHTTTWGSWWQNGVWGFKCCRSTIRGSYCVGGDAEAGQMFIPESVHSAMQELASARRRSTDADTEERVFALPGKRNAAAAAAAATALAAEEAVDGDAEREPGSGSDDDDDDDDRAAAKKGDEKQLSRTERKKSSKKSKKSKKAKRKHKSKKTKKASKKSDSESETSSDDDADDLKKALRAEEKSQAKADAMLQMDERKRTYNSMFDVKEPTEHEIEAYLMKRRRDDDPMAQ